MIPDLEILARELKQIAEGEIADTTADLMVWAEGWLLTLADLGVKPAALPERTS